MSLLIEYRRLPRPGALIAWAVAVGAPAVAGCGEDGDVGSGALPPQAAGVQSSPAGGEPPAPPPPDSSATPPAGDEGAAETPPGDAPLSETEDEPAAGTGTEPMSEDTPVEEAPVEEPEPPVECIVFENPGNPGDGDVNVDLSVEFQTITGFGGISMVPFFSGTVLTPGQVDIAFGVGPGQLGLSILRYPLSDDPTEWDDEVPAAQRAVELGAIVVASPWTPPANLKTNNSTVGGRLAPANYGAYADHLLGFRDFMQSQGVPIEAISIQNEPDIGVSYDSCFWSPQEMSNFLIQQGPRFGETRIIASESFNFDRAETDPILQNPAASAQLDIVAGHLYGTPGGPFDYVLAREQGKEIWMTEHYTDSGDEPDRANFWPLALDVADEMTASMKANYNAYIWWYIRRGYGLIFDSEQVSKRGWLFSQFSRFVRPGYVRVAASDSQGVEVTAFKDGPENLVVVALNGSNQPQTVSLDVFGSCVTSFDQFTTSQAKNRQNDGVISLQQGRAQVTLDPQSLTSFVSRPLESAAE